MTTKKRVAKRRLTNIDFSQEGSHLALVHKDQGGSANGYSTLVMKATGKYSDEFLQKAAQVQVTLSFEEFLQRFFYMWEEDAKVLATMLGLQSETLEDELNEERMEFEEDQKKIAEKLKNFTILKNAYESDNLVDFLASLSEEDYLSVLQDQEMIEKALQNVGEQSPNGGGDSPINEAVKEQPITKKATKAVHTQEEDSMSGKAPEMIEKSQYEEVLKQQQETQELLQKALASVAEFEKKEKEAVAKARKADLLAAVEVEEVAETLFKAVGELEAEQFEAVVEVVKNLNAKVEKQGFFEEQGSAAEGQQDQNVSPVAKALRTRLTKSEQ